MKNITDNTLEAIALKAFHANQPTVTVNVVDLMDLLNEHARLKTGDITHFVHAASEAGSWKFLVQVNDNVGLTAARKAVKTLGLTKANLTAEDEQLLLKVFGEKIFDVE